MAQKIATLEQAFVEEIRDLYDAEKQLTRSLPKMAKASSSEELRNAFREHLEVTKGQVQRLEQVFQMLDQRARSKPCKGMKGLIEEGQEQMESNAEPNVKDLALIGAAQKVGEEAARQKGSRALVVTDAGVVKAGLVKPIVDALAASVTSVV